MTSSHRITESIPLTAYNVPVVPTALVSAANSATQITLIGSHLTDNGSSPITAHKVYG